MYRRSTRDPKMSADLALTRGAYRIVVDRATEVAWFTPDHYVTFYQL
jgi:guanyl-specific ribonuclease Sa